MKMVMGADIRGMHLTERMARYAFAWWYDD